MTNIILDTSLHGVLNESSVPCVKTLQGVQPSCDCMRNLTRTLKGEREAQTVPPICAQFVFDILTKDGKIQDGCFNWKATTAQGLITNRRQRCFFPLGFFFASLKSLSTFNVN